MRSSGDNLMSVGEVSRALGITRRIILNYEDKGLIEADVKDGFTGNRYYTTDTLTRIRTIRVFQDLGLSLVEIKSYFNGSTDLTPMIEHLEEIRDELNLNIEKLRERVNTGDIEFKVTEIPAQTIYKRTLNAPTVDLRKEHLRTVIPDAMRHYSSDTSKRMYFIEYRLDDPDTISYCIAVTKGSKGEYISEIPKEKVLCVFYHGGYESIPKVRDKMLEFAEKNGLSVKGVCRHIYLEGPAQHRKEKDFITQVALPIN